MDDGSSCRLGCRLGGVKAFVALLRAVNVGGTGKLPMAELRTLCEELGFENVKTYIQSGNVVFTSKLSEKSVTAKLEKALANKMGAPVGVHVRTASELDHVVARNPFPEAAPNQLLILFLDAAPESDALADVKIPGSEKLHLSGREIFIHFPDGMGNSKLRLSFTKTGTGRNLNSVKKLAQMAHDAES